MNLDEIKDRIKRGLLKLPGKLKEPLTKGLPAHLKDPANYDKIQRALLETLASTHSHSEMMQWAGCKSCMEKVREHKLLMKSLGFKTPAMYYEWKKTMEIMIRGLRDPIGPKNEPAGASK